MANGVLLAHKRRTTEENGRHWIYMKGGMRFGKTNHVVQVNGLSGMCEALT